MKIRVPVEAIMFNKKGVVYVLQKKKKKTSLRIMDMKKMEKR